MGHRKFIYFLFALLSLFVVNIALYSTSEDYQFLLKKLKYKEEVGVIDTENINDYYNIQDSYQEEIQQQISDTTVPNEADTINEVQQPQEQTKVETPTEISEKWKTILGLMGWNFTQTETLSSLFDLTTEYPSEYLEFRDADVTLYYFPGKTYDQVVDIFFAIAQWLPFTLNKNDVLAEKSFFINLDTEFQDDQVRIVFLTENEVFWLKIKKDAYNSVKEDVKTLKK